MELGIDENLLLNPDTMDEEAFSIGATISWTAKQLAFKKKTYTHLVKRTIPEYKATIWQKLRGKKHPVTGKAYSKDDYEAEYRLDKRMQKLKDHQIELELALNVLSSTLDALKLNHKMMCEIKNDNRVDRLKGQTINM
jgi:coenzyme F420-reducing hydrogenase alpha subunit